MQSPARHRYRFPIPLHKSVLGASVSLWQISLFIFINLRIALSATRLFSKTSALPPVISKSQHSKDYFNDPANR
jgi:hypothetical protein